MSSTPSPAQAAAQSTAGKFLDALSGANNLISVAVPIAGLLIPLVVQVIKSISGSGTQQTITYTLVIQEEQAALDAIIAAGAVDLTTVNAELVRMGLPPLA